MAFGREQSFITLILIVLSHRRYPYSFSIGGFGHAYVYDFGSTGEPYWRRARMVLNRNRWPAAGSLDGPRETQNRRREPDVCQGFSGMIYRTRATNLEAAVEAVPAGDRTSACCCANESLAVA